ncbi:MAG: hypothetical protein ACPGJS_04465 [Flammeovirgaceae bacterium]
MMIFKKVYSLVFILSLTLAALTSCEDNGVEPTNSTQNANGDFGSFLNLRQQANNTTTNSADSSDIACFAINYPVDVIIPNQAPQAVNSDDELDALVTPWFDDPANWDSDEWPTFVFPVSVTLEDGSTLVVNNDEELCDLFFECFSDWDDDWDWDDDDDYDDEECDEDEDDCECDEDEDDDEDDEEDDD